MWREHSTVYNWRRPVWALVLGALLLQLGLGTALAARGLGSSCHEAPSWISPAPGEVAATPAAHEAPQAQHPAHRHDSAHASGSEAGDPAGGDTHTVSHHHCCATGVGGVLAWLAPPLGHSPPQLAAQASTSRALAPDLRPPIV